MRKPISPSKPKLSQGAWQMVLKMHAGWKTDASAAGVRNELIALDMLCYSEGWKLTKRGKDLARYLTERK